MSVWVAGKARVVKSVERVAEDIKIEFEGGLDDLAPPINPDLAKEFPWLARNAPKSVICKPWHVFGGA